MVSTKNRKVPGLDKECFDKRTSAACFPYNRLRTHAGRWPGELGGKARDLVGGHHNRVSRPFRAGNRHDGAAGGLNKLGRIEQKLALAHGISGRRGRKWEESIEALRGGWCRCKSDGAGKNCMTKSTRNGNSGHDQSFNESPIDI